MSIREWFNRLKEQNPNIELLQDRLKTFIREKRKDRGFHGPPFGGLFPEREPLEPLNPPPLGIFPPGPPPPDAYGANNWVPDHDHGRALAPPPLYSWSWAPVFPPGPPPFGYGPSPYSEEPIADRSAQTQLDKNGKGYFQSGSFSQDEELHNLKPKQDRRARNSDQSTVRKAKRRHHR